MVRINANLPDFLLIGANKGGTTSIYKYLIQHPSIAMSNIKEPMYFVADPILSNAPENQASIGNPTFTYNLDDYSSLFPDETPGVLLGEASTAYLCNPMVAAPNIKSVVPNVKLIAVLREPIDRALSAYKMVHGQGFDDRDLSAAFRPDSSPLLIHRRHGVKDYLRIGLYGQQIREFLRYFLEEQMLFIKYDNFRNNPQRELERICEFLEIVAIQFDVSKSFNRAVDNATINQTSQISTLGSGQLEQLKRVFREDIALTQYLTGLDLGDWQ